MTGSAAERELVEKAIEAKARAHCPYSSYPVGCAVLDDSGAIHVGTNVENAAYPVGTCAEAGAIAAMVAAGGKRIASVAVSSDSDPPGTPCGACRQRIREFAAGDVPVIVCDGKGERARHTLAELLPESFGPEHLG